MTSRHTITQYNHFERVKTQLADIFLQAIVYRLTHDQILEKLTKLRQTNSYKRLTVYHIGYVRGLIDGYMANIWRNHVVWMLGPASGPIHVQHSEWTEEMSTLCRQPGALYGGHFWTDDNGKPTEKVFTEYKPTNAGDTK